MKALLATTLLLAFPIAAGCRGERTPSNDPSPASSTAASVAVPATATPLASGPMGTPRTPGSSDGCPGEGPRACAMGPPESGPYIPPPEDKPAPVQPEKRHKTVGTLDDWIREYEGISAPERKKPPQLGVLTDLHEVPRSTLVYVRSGHLVRVDLPSGKETQLTAGSFTDHGVHWTRDGRFVFFLSNREGVVDKVFRMRPDGSDAVAVTKPIRTTGGLSFAWEGSDDGEHIAYIPSSPGPEQELHLVDVASGRDDVVYRDAQLAYPSFSRDGKTLFFVAGWYEPPGKDATHPKLLGAVDLATRATKTLPNAGVTEITSPWDLGDGRLLFVASADFSMMGRMPRMQTMPVGGGAWTQVADFTTPIGYMHPTPTVDGKKVALSTSIRQGGFGADWYGDVSVMALGGAGAPKPLTAAFPRPFYGAASPTWAKDGRHLAFVLTLCPYASCEVSVRSVVLVDTDAAEPKLAFVGYGGAPAFAPVAPL